MSVGPLGGLLGSAAGAPYAKSQGSDVQRAKQDTNAQQRQVGNEQKAESAAGIAATDAENQSPQERDADGRRLWEEPESTSSPEQSATDDDETTSARSKDVSGESGSQLDLSG